MNISEAVQRLEKLRAEARRHNRKQRPMNITPEQSATIEKLRQRWHTVGDPQPYPCDDCVVVQVSGENGYTMTIGIESDGYAHS